MANRAARITQSEIARIVRGAKKAGAAEVEVRVGEASVIVRMQSTDAEKDREAEREIVL